PEILFAQTKIDTAPHWRRVLDLNLSHLAAAGIPVTAFPITAALAATAHQFAGTPVLTGAAAGHANHGLDDRPDPTDAVSHSVGTELRTRSGLPALVARLT